MDAFPQKPGGYRDRGKIHQGTFLYRSFIFVTIGWTLVATLEHFVCVVRDSLSWGCCQSNLQGIKVKEIIALEIPDNLEVATIETLFIVEEKDLPGNIKLKDIANGAIKLGILDELVANKILEESRCFQNI